MDNTVDNGNGWGATWSTMQSNSTNTSGGFDTEDNVLAAGSGKYINYAEGATFTASAMIATDAADPLTGSGEAHVRFEFLVDGTELNQADRQFSEIINVDNISETYSMVTLSYTLTADDVTNGINGINVGLGTDGSGFEATDGLILFDDLVFEVDGAFVITAIPEPATASLMLAGVLGLCGIRRRKN